MVTNPRTLPQQVQRQKMKTLTRLSRVFAPVIRVGFPERERSDTAFNAFTSINMPAVEVSDDLKVTVHYDRLLCSNGSRILPEVTATKDVEKRELVFSHEEAGFSIDVLPDDMLYAVLFSKEKNVMRLYPLNRASETAAVTVTPPDSWDMTQIVAYVFALSENRHYASPSVCVISE